MKTLIIFILIAFLLPNGLAKGGTLNVQLRALYKQDQSDRQSISSTDELIARDKHRRHTVQQSPRLGLVKTAHDYYVGSLIFLHGTTVEDARNAYVLALRGSRLAPREMPLLWIKAAAWDRYMMYSGRNQWYGTQYTSKDAAPGKLTLVRIERGAIDDAERVAAGILPLADIPNEVDAASN
jgi:hypothetical protein